MKRLNIGCGRDYRPGWINADYKDPLVADVAMPAWDFMNIDDASLDEIYAGQVIEHLGFFKSIYFLAEAYRALKPGGELMLELPDIEAAMDNFQKGDEALKQASLEWMFGSETPGMEHRFCPPQSLALTILKQTGFQTANVEKYSEGAGRPALRIRAEKPLEHDGILEALARARKRLVRDNDAGFDDELLSSQINRLLLAIVETLKQSPQAQLEDAYLNCCKMAAYSADTVTAIMDTLAEEYPIAVKYAKTAGDLKAANFQALLKSSMLEGKKDYENFALAMLTALETVKSTVAGTPPEAHTAMPEGLSEFFSPEILRREAYGFAHRGIKAFALSNFEEATALFKKAGRLDGTNPLWAWNMARLAALDGDGEMAEKCYAIAGKIVLATTLENRQAIASALEKEAQAMKAGSPAQGPVTDRTLKGVNNA